MSGHATGAQNHNNMDYSKIMYVAVTGDTKYDVNTVSRPTQYKSGYSPNELVFATEVRLPPPVGELHWVARTAAVSPDVVPSGPLRQTPESYLEDRSQRAQELYNNCLLYTSDAADE